MKAFTLQGGLIVCLIDFIYLFSILATIKLNTTMQKILKQRWSLGLGYGLPALFLMVFIWITTPPVHAFFLDFYKGYYPAGSLVWQNPSLMYSSDVSDLKFVNIPIIAFLFTPFSLFDQSTAGNLMLALGVLAAVAACSFLLRLTKVSGWRRLALIGVFVINEPLYYSLKWGNLTHFVLLLMLAAFFCLQTKREIWVGVLLAIASLIKIPLFFLGIYFILRGRWRVCLGFGGALLAIVGTSVLLFGIDLHLLWYHKCIQPFAGKPLGAYNVQSLDSLLVRLLINYDLHQWIPIEVDLRFKIIRYVLFSILIGGTIWVCWSSKISTLNEENLEFSTFLCLALIITPISWTHYYLLLLLPLSLYLGDKLAVPNGKIWFWLIVLSTLLISMPSVVFEPRNPALKFLVSNLLVPHNFWGGLLLLAVLLAARRHNSKLSHPSQAQV